MKTALQCILFVGLVGGIAFAVPAQDVIVAVDDEKPAKAVQQHTGDAEGKDRVADRYCLRDTGSRIVAMHNAKRDRAEKRCVNALGRAYTGEEIRSTGMPDLAGALRMLDPAIP